MNDSVREELQSKITFGTPAARPVSMPGVNAGGEQRPADMVQANPPISLPSEIKTKIGEHPTPLPRAVAGQPPAATTAERNRETSELHAPKTSPTLVEFQAKQSALPDWRLQLQNSVRQRRGVAAGGGGASAAGQSTATQASAVTRSQPRLATSGANALKAEPALTEARAEPQQPIADPRVANALKRIDHSRKTFANQPQANGFSPAAGAHTAPKAQPAAREARFNVVARSSEPALPRPAERKPLAGPPSPRLVPTFKIEKPYDTNKLPRLATAAPAERADEPDDIAARDESIAAARPTLGPLTTDETFDAAELEAIHETAADETAAEDEETIDDLAPISVRFNAGLFDLIIGSFAAAVLLLPFVLMGGDWFTMSGLLAFAATLSIVMFVYMTVSVGMYGRTIGMRMFSLELIDVEANDYPTFHQAAVNAAVYLLTLPVAGIGFLTMFFNEEQRAAHDLAAGTIVVTEA